MAKVNKAYSLDPRTVELLEQYCQEHDNWDRKWSRSKVVNDAILWYLEGDTAELVAAQENLMKKVKELAKLRDSQLSDGIPLLSSGKTNRPWWRRLLLGQ